MKFSPVTFVNAAGEQQQVQLSLADYKIAEKRGLTLAQHINLKYPTNPEKFGTSFNQMLASTGLFMREDRNFGIRAPTLAQIFDDGYDVNLGAVTAPDGSQSDTPAGRLFFPAALLEMIESNLRPNLESYIGSFMQMVAFTRSVDSPKYEQVKIDYTNPRGARGMPISQLALPTTMVTITASQVNKTIPTISIGMEISREALALATLDLVGLAVSEQAINERSSRMINDFVALVQGSTDTGDVALVSSPITSYDASIVANGVCTQKGWVKFLRTNQLKRTITDVVCDLDTFLAIQGRTGRPTIFDLSGMDERLNSIPRTNMRGIDDTVNFFITEGSPLGANTLVGLDRSKALRRVVYVGATYQAIEEFVLRKAFGMRIDWAERIEQAGYSEAFQMMTLTTT